MQKKRHLHTYISYFQQLRKEKRLEEPFDKKGLSLVFGREKYGETEFISMRISSLQPPFARGLSRRKNGKRSTIHCQHDINFGTFDFRFDPNCSYRT